MNSKIFFIIGVGGAGKSTLVNNFKDTSPNFYVYDFDEVGVPENVDANWRRETTNYWLEKAQKHYDKGEIMVLCGFLVPSEAEKQANFNSDIKINYGLLDIKPETIKERLTKRGWNENKIVYHIEWANLMKEEIKKYKDSPVVSGDDNYPQEVVTIFETWIKEQLVQVEIPPK